MYSLSHLKIHKIRTIKYEFILISKLHVSSNINSAKHDILNHHSEINHAGCFQAKNKDLKLYTCLCNMQRSMIFVDES